MHIYILPQKFLQCKNLRQVHFRTLSFAKTFITLVNTYSVKYGNSKKNVPLVKNTTEIYGKYLAHLLFYE